MTSSNNKRVMSAWDMQFLDAEDNGDVLVGDDKVEDKTSSKDLKPWTTDFYVYLLSVVDCMMFKRKKTDWREVCRLMNCARTPEQDVKFTPKECENQYQYIIKTFEKEREEKGTSHKNDQIPLVRDPSVRAELFQKLMQERKVAAEKNLAKLHREIAEVAETIVSLEADEFDDGLSDISEANRSDSDSEDPIPSQTSHKGNNVDFEDPSTLSGIGDERHELHFWDRLCSGENTWGPELEALFCSTRIEEGNEEICENPKVAQILGPHRLLPGHTRKIDFNDISDLNNSDDNFGPPVSPKLSNLLDSAIASGEPDIVPKSVPNTPVNNAPTLSKLLEMPVRDRGQPLPTISSLMEPDAAKDNGTESKFADGFGANSLSYLRDLSSPIKSLLMGSPTASVSPKMAPTRASSQHQITNTLPALTLLMPSGPSSKNLTLPDDIGMDDNLDDMAVISSANDSQEDLNRSLDSLLNSQEAKTKQPFDESDSEKVPESDGKDSSIEEIDLAADSADSDCESSDSSSTDQDEEVISGEEEAQYDGVDLNSTIETVDLCSSADSSVVEIDPADLDDSPTVDETTKPCTTENKSSTAVDIDLNNELVIKLTTLVRAASPNSQSDELNSTDNSKRKSPVKAGSRVKDRTESDETADEETSNQGMDSSTSTRVTRRSAKATLIKSSDEKIVVSEDNHPSSIKEQEENGEKTQPRVARSGGKKYSESFVPDAESKDEDTGKRITRARNRASVAPRERTKSSSSAKGSATNEPVTSADSDSTGAPDPNIEPEIDQDKDANDNEPKVPEKPELSNTFTSDAIEPEKITERTESIPATETDPSTSKLIETVSEPDVSQPSISTEGKLAVDVDEESSDKETNKRKSPKPALRTKERIESGEMADDDNSNSAFDSSSKPRMTRRSGKLTPVKEIKTVQEDNKSTDTMETPKLKGRSARKRPPNDESRQTEVDSEVSEEVESEKRVTRARNRLSVTPRIRTKSSGSIKGLGTDQDASSETERSGPSRSLRSRGGPSTSSVIDNFLPPLPTSADSNPSSPSSSTTNSVIMEDEKELLKIKNALLAFHKRLIVPKSAQIFLKKSIVEPSVKYLKAVKKPTDLHLIKQKIESGEIRSWSQMKREVILMIINFNMFFPHGHPMHTAAEDYYNDINHQFDIDFYGFAAMLASEDESNKDTVRNEGETGSESELKTPESKPKGKPGRKRRTPSTSVDEVVETKRRTLRTSTTAVTTSSWQGASRKKPQHLSPDIVSTSSYSSRERD